MSNSKDCMLLLVDALNLYYSAKELYGQASRIDFRKLRDTITSGRTFGAIYSIAFMPTFKEEPETLFNALKRMGYEIVLRTTDFELCLQEKIFSLAETYQVVAVASGAQAFHPLYRSLREAHIRTEAYSFRDAANAELPSLVNKFGFLGPEILVGQFRTLQSSPSEETTNDDPSAKSA